MVIKGVVQRMGGQSLQWVDDEGNERDRFFTNNKELQDYWDMLEGGGEWRGTDNPPWLT